MVYNDKTDNMLAGLVVAGVFVWVCIEVYCLMECIRRGEERAYTRVNLADVSAV